MAWPFSTVTSITVQVVAESRSDETFVALCLLTVTGASLITQKLGFSDTAGAFAAGVLLSETNFRSQVRHTGPSCVASDVWPDARPTVWCYSMISSPDMLLSDRAPPAQIN